MISEKELKTLIQNQDTIYYLEFNDDIKELKLNADFDFGYFDIDFNATRSLKEHRYYYFDEDGDECEYAEYYLFDRLYKTREQAEWVSRMHTYVKTYFEPPIWETFLNIKKYIFVDKDLERHRLWLDIEDDETSDYYNQECLYIDCEVILIANKENYEKAVEIAKKMFLGEEL